MHVPTTAIIQCADTGPLESLVNMLEGVGMTCRYPDRELRDELRRIGCDTVLEPADLVRSMGYEYPRHMRNADSFDMAHGSDTLFIDLKAHRNLPMLRKRWPNLKVLWYRINGGQPEHVIRADGFDCGDEVNPPCPVITPNQWYTPCQACGGSGFQADADARAIGSSEIKCHGLSCTACKGKRSKAYTFWPPFVGWNRYQRTRMLGRMTPPVCLIHNVTGWGYAKLITPMQALGVKIYGDRSPNGLISHQSVPSLLSTSIAMVHLKSSDAPGYAIYEAMAAGCPVICTRRLIWRCKMQDLLIPGETCLVFDRETHDELSDTDVTECTAEVKRHLEFLADPVNNRTIGLRGREQLGKIMWSDQSVRDRASLVHFLKEQFGGTVS